MLWLSAGLSERAAGELTRCCRGVEDRLDRESPVAQWLMLLGAGGLGGWWGFAVERRGVGLWRREGVGPCACVRTRVPFVGREERQCVLGAGVSGREGVPW